MDERGAATRDGRSAGSGAARDRPAGVAIFPKSCTHFAPFSDMFVNQLVLERSDVLRPATKPR